MAVKQITDVRNKILQHLETEERNLRWLSRKTGIVYATLYSCFIQRTFNLSEESLEKINDALGTEFELSG